MYDSSEIIKVLSDTPSSTSYVAEKLGCAYFTAWRKLRQFHQEGLIEGTKVKVVRSNRGEWEWRRKA